MRKIPLFRLSLSLLLVATLLAAALPVSTVLAETVEMQTWGTVILDGVPAELGTRIEVFVGTDNKSSGYEITNRAVGEYGSMKIVSDDGNDGQPLTYKVNGVVATTEKVMRPCDTFDTPVFGLCNQVVNLVAVSGAQPLVWNFPSEGGFPRHLPDAFNGQVVLDELVDVPLDVQGVYYEDGTYWAPGAPGTKLKYLVGGLYASYVVMVTAQCRWNIQ